MKVIPIATNHIHIELDCGETLDINDGTGTRDGTLLIQYPDGTYPISSYIVVKENDSEHVRIQIKKD